MGAQRRILIIGGGIAGLSTAYFLARESECSVTLLEKEESLGQHSTGKNAAILRSWTPVPELTRFAVESARFLNDPPAGFSDVPLVDPRGLILVTPHTEASARAVYEAAGVEAPPLVSLSPDEFRKLAPHFGDIPEGSHLLHFPTEGHLDVAAMVEGFARGAREAGAEIRTNTAVRGLVQQDGVVRGVTLADGVELQADLVVLAAGGWAGKLAQRTATRVRLRPTRRHLCVTEVDSTVDPHWPIVWSDSLGFYARPESGGLLLCPCDETDVAPDRCDVDPQVLELVAQKTQVALPNYANAKAAHFWAGMRTHAESGHFLIGPDEDVPGLFWVAGLGGHGMTSSAAIGRRACEALGRLAGTRANSIV